MADRVNSLLAATEGVFSGEAYLSCEGVWMRSYGVVWVSLVDMPVTHWMPLPDAPEVTCDGEAERLPAEGAGESAAEHAPAAAVHHSAVRGHGADHAGQDFGFGEKRATEFLEKFRETFEAYASLCLENAKGDANMDYTKGCIDRELARIMGSAFQPWEVRYPEKVFGEK